MIRKFILLFVITCSAANVAAQSSVDEMGEMLVHHFLTDVTTMQGSFEQSLIDADGTVVEVSSGTLEIERPVRFRWSYSEPY